MAEEKEKDTVEERLKDLKKVINPDSPALKRLKAAGKKPTQSGKKS